MNPAPVPIDVSVNRLIAKEIFSLAGAIRREPARLRCSIEAATPGFRGDVLRIGSGSVTIDLPVLGRWPLRDISPNGLADLLDDIHRAATVSMEHDPLGDADAARRVQTAVEIARIDGHPAGPDDANAEVEVCADESGRMILWTTDDRPERIPFDRHILETVDGEWREPHHGYCVDGSLHFAIVPSLSEDEGVTMAVPAMDPIARLRLNALVARIRAEGTA